MKFPALAALHVALKDATPEVRVDVLNWASAWIEQVHSTSVVTDEVFLMARSPEGIRSRYEYETRRSVGIAAGDKFSSFKTAHDPLYSMTHLRASLLVLRPMEGMNDS